MRTALEARLAEIRSSIADGWTIAAMFLRLRDPHGLHDAGVELQALQRAEAEILAVLALGEPT